MYSLCLHPAREEQNNLLPHSLVTVDQRAIVGKAVVGIHLKTRQPSKGCVSKLWRLDPLVLIAEAGESYKLSEHRESIQV